MICLAKFLRVRNGSPKFVLHIEREFVCVFAGFLLLVAYVEECSQIHIGIVFGAVFQVKLFVEHTNALTLFGRNVVVKYCFHTANILLFLIFTAYLVLGNHTKSR